LQLFATIPIKLYAGMTIAQVSFWKPFGEIKLYNGKYQGSTGPRISETYKEYQIKD
jgi:dCTP deaminase